MTPILKLHLYQLNVHIHNDQEMLKYAHVHPWTAQSSKCTRNVSTHTTFGLLALSRLDQALFQTSVVSRLTPSSHEAFYYIITPQLSSVLGMSFSITRHHAHKQQARGNCREAFLIPLSHVHMVTGQSKASIHSGTRTGVRETVVISCSSKLPENLNVPHGQLTSLP